MADGSMRAMMRADQPSLRDYFNNGASIEMPKTTWVQDGLGPYYAYFERWQDAPERRTLCVSLEGFPALAARNAKTVTPNPSTKHLNEPPSRHQHLF